TLRDKKVDELYLYDTTSKQISMANLKNKEVKILINDVANYKSYGSNMILFATSDVEKPGKTIIKLWDTDKAYTVHVLNESSVLLDMAEFDGSWYVALAPSIEDKIYIIKDPFDKIKDRPAVLAKTFAVMRLPEASFISFSANTRFLSAQAGNKFAVYDFETNRRFNYELEGEIPVTQQISWMDGHRFAFNHDNKTVVVEFDGTNKQELTNLISGATPFFTRDYQRLYTLTANKEQDTKVDLIRSSLKVDQDP
ncbi:hypothetical protein KDA11_00175, partial [Candidatus Saccharibacteria bacterium]|nr:hypothetical protein [Candidatus Saccharibacteria bacterium]